MKTCSLLLLAGLLTCNQAFAGDTGSLDLDDAVTVADGDEAAVAAGDGFLIVWQDGPTVIARELSSAGVSAGAPAVLDDIAQRSGAVAARHVTGGELVVAWSDPFGNYDYWGRPHEIFAQRLDGTTPIGSTLAMEDAGQDSTSLVGLETRGDGHFTVVWNNAFNYGPSSGKSQSVAPDDQLLGAASFSPALDIFPDGDDFAVLNRSTYGGSKVQRLAVDGTELGAEIAVNARAVDIAPSPGEGFLVVWRDFANNNFAQALDSDLNEDGDPVQISTSHLIESFPVVFEAPDGGFLTSWPIDDGTDSMRLRYLRPDGVPEPVIELASLTTFVPTKPRIAVDRFGRFIATWADNGTVWQRHGRIDRSIDVDAFDTAQAQLSLSPAPIAGASASSTASGLDMAGGERDLELTLLGGTSGDATVEVTGGQLLHRQSGDVTARSVLSWDQADGDATALDADGLRALDLTSGGTRDALLVDIAAAGAGASLIFELGDGGNTSSFTLDLPSGATAERFVLPLADFTGSADLAAAGSVSLTVDGSAAAGVDVTLDRLALVSRLEGRKTALDVNGGDLEPGDVLEYTVVIENPADAYAAAASAVTFSDAAPAGTSLLCAGADEPSTSQGSISGCVAGEGGQLDVDVGTLADGAQATITLRVTLLDTAPGRLCNDGLVSSATVADQLTDDPSTAAVSDATCVDATEPARVEIAKSIEVTADADGSGSPSPGDTVRLTDVVSHAGGSRDAEDLVLSTEILDGTVLGGVTTTQGTVISGDTVGDTSVIVELGTINPGGQATVSYDLFINSLGVVVQDFRAFTLVEGTGTWQRELLALDGFPFNARFDIPLDDALFADNDGNGFASPGDRLRYSTTVSNQGSRDGASSRFTSGVFDGASLVSGSVITTAGTILSGNDPGDTTVEIDLGLLGGLGSGTAFISFDVMIDDPIPGNADTISRRAFMGSIGSPSHSSDDPDTTEVRDATVTPIAIAPAVTASLTDSLLFDASGDGLVQTGDLVGYALEITNSGTGTVHETTASTASDPALRPLCGSIVVPDGVGVSCDGAVGGEIAFDIGRFVEAATVTASWTAEAIDPQFLAQICAQAQVVGLGVDLLSDDPDVAGAADPTCRFGTLSQTLIFYDGFESGETSAWFVSLP